MWTRDLVLAAALVEIRLDVRPEPLRKEVQRLLVHRAPVNGLGILRIVFVDPAERVERAVVGGRIALQALLQQAGDRALAAADRAVQQQHAAFDAVAGRGALERVHQVVERAVEAEDGVAAVVVGIVEEAVVGVLLATGFGHVHAVRQDHVVEPLIGGARDLGVLADDVEILGERSHPILAAELFAVLTLGN